MEFVRRRQSGPGTQSSLEGTRMGFSQLKSDLCCRLVFQVSIADALQQVSLASCIPETSNFCSSARIFRAQKMVSEPKLFLRDTIETIRRWTFYLRKITGNVLMAHLLQWSF